MLAHWKLDETSGEKAADSTVNEKDGTLRNMEDASWVPGKFGNALFFDGKDDQIFLPISVLAPRRELFPMVEDLDNATDAGFAYYASSVTNGDGFGTQNEVHIGLRDNEQINFYIHGANKVDLRTTDPFNDDNWHHVVAVSDLANQTYTLYVNGTDFKKELSVEPNNFQFNKVHRLGRPAANRRYYGGLIDDVRLYSEPLTEEEVITLYGEGFSDYDRPPTITLNGDNPLKVDIGTDFTDPGASATDFEDGDLGTIQGEVEGADSLDTSKIGFGK